MKLHRQPLRPAAAATLLALAMLAGSVAACQGCHATTNQPAVNEGEAQLGAPTIRLYIVSDLAGALEPCGCVKDQLGGLDHLAAWIEAERAKAPTSALLLAGPTFFMEPVLKDDHRAQDTVKAKTIAQSLKQLGVLAVAPGKNDWAAGPKAMTEIGSESGGAFLAGNVTSAGQPLAGHVVREINGVKVGVVGVSAPDRAEGGAPEGVTASPAIEAVKAHVADAKKEGAKVVVVLAAVGRGEAKRIADMVPDVTAIVVGSPGGSGDANTEAPPPERIGNVLIAETGNHLTTVAVLDLYVRDNGFAFADATGLELGRKRTELSRRIDELRGRIAQWESQGSIVDGGNAPPPISKEDLDARKADVAKLEAERAALDARPPPAKGSFFRYTIQEVRDALGKDKGVTDKMLAYYKEVNEHNKVEFASRVPRPAPAGAPSYVGVDACVTCHLDPGEVWEKTAHAHAYATLSKQFKEYNLDCVGCHVTGYDLPGGSTVTHVAKLENVGCEVCHGPGSKHAASPKKVAIPIAKPQPDACLACHHPPHVHTFDAKQKMQEILGPGHGKK
ncbi:MAG: Cytochrome c family protein [Myxococcaceae bacterium]|nr:Cytochrome c family protein [Myxococcaceae bacterium]